MRTRYRLPSLALEIVMILVALVFILPIYILVTLALKTPEETARSPLSLPESLYLDNFVNAWNQANLAPALSSSLLVTTTSIVALIALSSFAAYALARRTDRWNGIVYGLFLIGMMIPTQLGLIPLYQLMRDLGLLGNPLSLILFQIGHQLPLSIFLYVGFLRAIPRDYEEAAMIDGASRLRTFVSVIFPLLRPVTGTVIILNAIEVWNQFLVPLLYLGGSPSQTIPVSIFSFVGEEASQWNLVFAGLLIAMAPVLIAYFILQKKMIQGFASGLKG